MLGGLSTHLATSGRHCARAMLGRGSASNTSITLRHSAAGPGRRAGGRAGPRHSRLRPTVVLTFYTSSSSVREADISSAEALGLHRSIDPNGFVAIINATGSVLVHSSFLRDPAPRLVWLSPSTHHGLPT